MYKIKSTFGYIIFIILVIIIIIYSNYSNRNYCIKYLKELEFNGILTKKYIDKKQHNYPMIELYSLRNPRQQINLDLDQSGMFNYVETGDSLIKISGELKVLIYRGTKDTTYYLYNRCLE